MTDEINWRARAAQATLSVENVVGEQTFEPSGDVAVEKRSPRDGRLLYQFGEGDGHDIDRAVSAARAAFDDERWSGLPIHQRAAVFAKLADLIERDRERLGLYECLDVGKPISKATSEDIAGASGRFRDVAGLAQRLETQAGIDLGHMTYLRRKPVGVVGGIVGWNYPLAMAAGKLAPALIMGNSIVVKPSEFTSLSTQHLALLAMEAGVPPGVVNVVHGTGAGVGAAIAGHKDIDLVAFVGSSATGRAVMAAAGGSNMKRAVLECGGKSPYLVFDDCEGYLDVIASHVVAMAFPNQGALCVAGSRLLIQESVRERFMDLVLEKAAKLKPADPLDPATTFGALVNETHMNKVLHYIESGKADGADLRLGGEQVRPDGDPELAGGYYVGPTIFDRVDPNAKIAQEEIFGPVLSVFSFESDDEAIALANNSSFGLAAYAATTNLARAQRLGQEINSGTLTIIGSPSPKGAAPALGSDKHKQSGFGFSGGVKGLEAYSTATNVHLYV